MSTLSTQIRDAVYTRVIALKACGWKTSRKIPFPTIEPDMIPAVGIYLIRETMSPDGDSNVSIPRFIVDATISVMIIDQANKPDVLDGSVDAKIDLIQDTILRDISFLDLRDKVTGKPIIDSVTGVSRTYNFPKQGETYYVEARLQFTVRFMCFFEPIALNDLKLVHIDVNQGDHLIQQFNIETSP